MNMLISLIAVIISHYRCVSKHPGTHLKYIQFLFLSFILIKMGKTEQDSKKSERKKDFRN